MAGVPRNSVQQRRRKESGVQLRDSSKADDFDDDSEEDSIFSRSNSLSEGSDASSNYDGSFQEDEEEDEESDEEVSSLPDAVALLGRRVGANPIAIRGLVRGRGRGRGRGGGRKGKQKSQDLSLQWQDWFHDLVGRGAWGHDDDDVEFDWEQLVRDRAAVQRRAASPKLVLPLLPFQEEWLGWSLNQEGSEWKGGILADEMGMGKTIQAISLIVTSPGVPAPAASASNELPQMKATLVVLPVVAVLQWRSEIQKFTDGSVKVMVYHGNKRGATLTELASYDVVLTTYSIVENEFRRNVQPPKVACKWCKRQFSAEKLRIHCRYFCGPHARRTEKQSKQTKKRKLGESSYVRTAGAESGSDVEMVDSDDDQPLKGGKRAASSLKGKGKVVTDKVKITKEQLEGCLDQVNGQGCSTTASGRPKSMLFSVKWARIILDEAHSIKDRRCNTAKAVYSLESVYKWALSGTPLQNRVGELYSLVRYLQIYPFSYYFCSKCDCKSLEHKFGQCTDCKHPGISHFCWWNKFISNPIKKHGYVAGGRKAMMLLKNKLLDSVLLRRTKMERAADLALPPRKSLCRRDSFDVREADFYQALYTQSHAQYDSYVSAGTLLNNYAHIFDLLTRLRQAVNHPYLVMFSATANSVPRQQATAFDRVVHQVLGEHEAVGGACGICHDPLEDPVASGCQHVFCRVCIQGYLDAAPRSKGKPLAGCPTCNKPLTIDLTGEGAKPAVIKNPGYKQKSILSRIDLSKFQSSTKIEALREEILLMLERDPAAKAIVFSQFTSMLDLIGYTFEKKGITFVKLDGSMSMAARDEMIDRFTNVAECKVFLMSLKAGGVALNLTVASHVFLMDPWWNPAVEQQAQDRIHRLGQYKPIKVTRFVIENTIEERILKLQEKKQLVFEGTVGRSSEALGKLTPDDLQFLFTQ